MELILLQVLVVATAILLYLGLHGYLVAGYDNYERRFIGRLSRGLADNFLFLEPRIIFFGTLGLVFVGGAVSYSLFGLTVALVFMAVAALAPLLVLFQLKRKRNQQFVYQLPDCLSTIQMSLRAGSNFARAVQMVVEQQPAPISQELSLVVSEAKLGRNIDDALNSLYRRVNTPEVELFVSAVAISRTVGGNLADTLESLADTIRERLQVEGKIKALTAMGRAQGWVVGLVPIGVTYMLYRREPESVAALVNEPIGWVVSGALVLLGILAAYLIYRIVNIDV
jgi:tight adherence protein B